MRVSSAEDFSDVERALDALADGSFQESIKKKEARQNVTKTLKMIVAIVVTVLVVIAGVLWYLLPSSHEKLVAQYEQLMSQQDADPTNLVRLFLDAAIEKDEEIFRKIAVMTALPEITSGKILGASDEYEKTSIGSPGQVISSLKGEIAALEEQISEKTKFLNEYSSKTFSPAALEEILKSLEKKIEILKAEFEAKDAENAKKLRGLQRELAETQDEIQKNQQISRKYLDATDTVGKALYTNSVTKLRSLAEQKARLEAQIQQENTAYQQHSQELKAEYAPRFSELEERVADTKAMLHEASLLQDASKSPVVILSKELEQLTQTIIDKKNALEQAEHQLKEALSFFLSPEKKNQIMNEQDSAEFSHVSKNVAALVKVGKSSEQQVSIVLKRYEAIVSSATLQSNWLIEKIAK
ncbi:chromosome segregation ATPases [Candidatus Vecturithrix granuli]|uniref:Chromosome segregation ATPases n=1 Tax=Vecturithrix granuli TaxID=1499967 RepID=A0A081BY06_VECG1|nr:chromosome segregation ATPases [Candidatus Vecturithrix granuli]